MNENKKGSECNQKNSQKCPDMVWFYIDIFLGKVSAKDKLVKDTFPKDQLFIRKPFNFI